jgi:hypothetical protein
MLKLTAKGKHRLFLEKKLIFWILKFLKIQNFKKNAKFLKKIYVYGVFNNR